MIYLATPYSHDDAEVREHRFAMAAEIAAAIIRSGTMVFSPICHSHPIAEIGGLGLGWESWREFDLKMLEVCDELWVAKIDGWELSNGVWCEIEEAKRIGIPVKYFRVKGGASGLYLSFQE